jgi:hypothetical protein
VRECQSVGECLYQSTLGRSRPANSPTASAAATEIRERTCLTQYRIINCQLFTKRNLHYIFLDYCVLSPAPFPSWGRARPPKRTLPSPRWRAPRSPPRPRKRVVPPSPSTVALPPRFTPATGSRSPPRSYAATVASSNCVRTRLATYTECTRSERPTARAWIRAVDTARRDPSWTNAVRRPGENGDVDEVSDDETFSRRKHERRRRKRHRGPEEMCAHRMSSKVRIGAPLTSDGSRDRSRAKSTPRSLLM